MQRTYGFVGGADGEAFVRVQQSGADNLFELARDFQGTILALIQRTNPASVSVVERYRYEPFGKVAIENASGQPLPQSGYGNDRFFLGRTWDAEVGLYDVRARWYEPDLGAFLAPDPLGAVDSWNFYQYGLAAPSIFSDSSGRSVWDFVKGVAAGLGMGTWDLAVSVVGTGWDLIRHPIDTSKEIAEGFGELKDALLDGDWETLAEVLSPELVALAQDWDNLSDFEKGKLIGEAAAQIGGAAAGGLGGVKIAKKLKAARAAAKARKALAAKIARGHAWRKHVIKECQFGSISVQEFEEIINNAMKNATKKKSGRNGRTAYWDEKSNVIVVHDPGASDGGTAFIADGPGGGQGFMDQFN